MQTTLEKTHSEQLQELGLKLESTLVGGQVDKEGWQNILYTVTLKMGDRLILTTEYRLGIAHVKLAQPGPGVLSEDERNMFDAWKTKPSANFIDKELQARVAGKLARAQKVQPQLADVIHSLLLDSSACTVSFEDWARDCGYDTDSRKAEDIYRKCQEVGFKLLKLPSDVIEKAREILQDY